jgi:hypothetical protein
MTIKDKRGGLGIMYMHDHSCKMLMDNLLREVQTLAIKI